MSFFARSLKSDFNKTLLALLLLCAATDARAGLVHQRMEQMEGHMAAVEEAVKRGGSVEKALPHAAALVEAFEELDQAQTPYSSDPLWHTWLADSAAAARRLQAALAAPASDLKAAAAELHTLDSLRDQAHAHFRPGLLGRFERWLQRIRHHEAKAPPPAVAPAVPGPASGQRAP